METIQTLISESDALISKESFKYAEADMDRLLVVCNHLSDLLRSKQEQSAVDEMKHDNKRDGEFVALKEETNDGKKVHTDKTAEAFLNGKYEQEELVFLTNKYLFKVIESKLRLLERKEQIVKKSFKS